MQAIRSSLTRVIAVVLPLAACHRHAESVDVAPPPPAQEVSRVEREGDANIAMLFRDTAPSNAFVAEGRDYDVQNATDRKALQAALKKERALWQANKPRNYRFLLRADCFCPGPHGWFLAEVRPGQLLRAWDRTGRRVDAHQWYTFTIDNLYDSLERLDNQQSHVQIAFDERWHYPRYVRTSMIYPDGWSITQIRGFKPL